MPFFYQFTLKYKVLLKLKMNTLKTTIKISITCLITGAILLVLHFIFKTEWSLISATYLYFLITVLVNCLFLTALIVALVLDKHKLDTLKSIGIIFFNIPIALLYVNIITNT